MLVSTSHIPSFSSMRALAGANEEFLRRSVGLTPHDASRVAALLLWGALWLAGLTLAARRLAGALAAPLEPAPLLATALACVAIAAAARFCWHGDVRWSEFSRSPLRRLPEERSLALLEESDVAGDAAETGGLLFLHSAAAERMANWAAAPGLLLVGLGLWLPATSPRAIAAFWTLVIVEEVWAVAAGRFRKATPTKVASEPAAAATVEPAAPDVADFDAPAPFSAPPFVPAEAETEAAPSETEPAAAPMAPHRLAGPHFLPPPPPAAPLPPGKCDLAHVEPAAPHFTLPRSAEGEHAEDEEQVEAGERLTAEEQLVQQLTRTTTAAGADVLRATLYASFPPGSRTASVHVAFCPPFASLPHAEFHQASGPAARIKLAQLLAHGARFDVKLSSPAAESQTVCIELTTESAPNAD